ncbi:hypothetical protein AHAS_Ahas08G0134800 [Arachis hypogaea]
MLLEAPATSMLSATFSTSASKTTVLTRSLFSTEATPEVDSRALVSVPPSSSLTVTALSKRVSKKNELVRVSELSLHEKHLI